MARMTAVEARAWVAFANVVQGFLGNKKDDNYEGIVDDLLLSLRGLGCRMSIKLHYLHIHLDSHMMSDYCWSLMIANPDAL